MTFIIFALILFFCSGVLAGLFLERLLSMQYSGLSPEIIKHESRVLVLWIALSLLIGIFNGARVVDMYAEAVEQTHVVLESTD
jgi:uncharacterized protein YneF (UPF0154 family)